MLTLPKPLLAAFLCALASVAGINLMSLSAPLLISNLGFSSSNVAWATSVYLLAELIAIPTLPFWVKRYGTAPVLKCTVLLFTASSLFCMFTEQSALFLLSRAVQGASGGLLLPLTHIMIRLHLPAEHHHQTQASFSGVMAFAPVLGALWGGATAHSSVFWLFSGVSFMGGLALFILLVQPKREPLYGQDQEVTGPLPSALVFMGVGLSVLVYLLDRAPEYGFFHSVHDQFWLVIGLVFFICGTIHQAFCTRPALDVAIFRRFDFNLICAAYFFSGIVIYGFLFTFPYYFIVIRGYAPFSVIPLLLMTAVPQIFIVRAVKPLCARFSANKVAAFGSFLFAISAALSCDISAQYSIADMWLIQLIRAFAAPLMVIPLGFMLLDAIPEKYTADGGTAITIFRILGGAIGVSGFLTLVHYLQQKSLLSGWGTFQASRLPFPSEYTHSIITYTWDAAFQQSYAYLTGLLCALAVFLYLSKSRTKA